MLRVATNENGDNIVVADDPVRYAEYIHRITARYGNQVYHDGKFISREQWEADHMTCDKVGSRK